MKEFIIMRRRLPETSGAFTGISCRKHPFYDVIVDTPLPDNWKNLTIDKCDGSTKECIGLKDRI